MRHCVRRHAAARSVYCRVTSRRAMPGAAGRPLAAPGHRHRWGCSGEALRVRTRLGARLVLQHVLLLGGGGKGVGFGEGFGIGFAGGRDSRLTGRGQRGLLLALQERQLLPDDG